MSAIRRAVSFLALLGIVATASACAQSPLTLPLTFRHNIQLPRDSGPPAIDLLTLDSRNERLYVPHGSNNALDLVDTTSGKYVGSVLDLPGIKAIALSADPTIVFTADGSDGSVSIVDVKAMKILGNVKLGTSADAIDYDPAHGIVVVSIEGDSLAFIDEKTRKETGKLPLNGKPELMAVDPQRGQVFVAVNDKDRVVLVDPVSRSIIKTYKGCDIKSPTGLVFDPAQQRLFVANAIPHSANVVSVIDVLLDRCLGSVDIDHSPDQAAFNQHLHHMYTANAGSNNVSVIDTVSLKPLGVIGTGRQAGTIAVDSTSDLVFVAVARAGLIAVYHDP
ncbi:MAG TPA: hypothetical protein VIN39_01590 [Candidatus Dormibacteraeota bacterium]